MTFRRRLLIGVVGDDSLHNVGCVLAASLVGDVVVQVLKRLPLPSLDLVDASSRILVEGNVVAVDKLGVFRLDEEVVILRVVLAGLGAIVAEATDILITDKVLAIRVGHLLKLCDSATLDLGIEVVAVRILKL